MSMENKKRIIYYDVLFFATFIIFLLLIVTSFFESYNTRVLQKQVNTLEIKLNTIYKELELKQNKINKLLRKRVIKATITAYTPSENETDDTPYTTSYMKRVNPKYVAFSKPVLEELKWTPGEKIYIDGVGIKTIGDKMNKRFRDFRFDLFMWNKNDAKKWGCKKEVTVYLLGEHL